MSYRFAEQLLLRLPAYTAKTYEAGRLYLLRDPFFQAAIYLASPGFFARLRECNFNFQELTTKEQATVLKYMNRTCFRPTPFGLFASVSLTGWGDAQPMMAGNLTGILLPDEAFVQAAAQSLLSQATERAYLANPTIYRVLKDFRFIRTEVSKNGKRSYQLQSTAYSVVLKDLLRFCQKPRSTVAIIGRIGELANTGQEESDDYFQFLSDSQVLVNQQRASITGQNHLSVLLSGVRPNDAKRSAESLTVADLPSGTLNVGSVINYKKHLQRLSGSDQWKPSDQPASCMLLRQMSGTLDVKYQEAIRHGLYALDCLCPADEMPALRQFINTFKKDFEGQRLPLLAALDPERGIGYEVPDIESPNPLLETLNVHPASTVSDQGMWTPAHTYLMERWISAERDQRPVIRLDEKGLKQLSSRQEPQITLGLSLLFRVAQEKVYLESAGGNNPLSLLGRFTAADDKLANAARAMAEVQELLNPDLLFAELLHLSDPHIDNVNRRAHLWNLELPVTAASTLPEERQLHLNDLYVEIVDNQVYLWSSKHRKYVIPRLSTAYNHSLDKLPLFRFLADLPYQYGRCNLSFCLRRFFPGLNYYPRVEYGKAILCPATWIISQEVLYTFQEAPADKLPEIFLKAP